MHDQISDALANSESFDISVAFVSTGAILSLFEDFRSHHANAAAGSSSTAGNASVASASQTSRLITSTKNHFNDPQTFWELLHLQQTSGVDVRVWEGVDDGSSAVSQGQGQPFHPKGYVFSRRMHNGTPYYELFVGSSNLTGAALNTQREWNLKVSSLANGELVRQIHEEIDSQVADSVPLTKEWIKQYEEDFKKYAPPRRNILKSLEDRDIQPNAMQREALANLKRLREQGEHRAIIVSATGTGKTYLSAFDVRAYRPKRMLYIAQQQMILKAAMKSYQKVLDCDESELGLYSGTSKQQDRRYVFATVQTMRQPEVLAQFASDEFDYILVDEVHHAGAAGYQRVIDHFADADFMLGMTATPERTDGINIFELFGHNIAYEIRLQKALDENMLCPFHYYGVAEYLGSDDDPNQTVHRLDVAHGLDAEQSAQLTYEIGQLATEQRVRYIIDKLREYGQFNLPVTGLVFCSRQDEAHELSRLFNRQFNQQAERSYRTAAVTSTDADGKPVSQEQRDEYVRRLTDGELDYLFTVDLFNEGVDIPAVNQIVMLRSTESSIVFTQQLGRGLRKFPHKDSVVVIDFIGNYANNYLIPVALYGNTGDRDRARRNLQRKSIGLSSISFDPIAKERVLKSLDTADWSEMKKLSEQYRQVRYELGRIPMLMDIYEYDPSLPYTLAAKRNNYLDFVRSRENSLGGGKRKERSFADQLEPVSDVEDAILKMATELLLPGIRPHELVILERLCRFADERPGDDASAAGAAWAPPFASLSRSSLIEDIRSEFPQTDLSDTQFDSAISVLDYSYFTTPNRKRFGEQPLVETVGTGVGADVDADADNDEPSYRLSDAFVALLSSNRTFRIFFADTLRTGLANCHDLFREAQTNQRTFDRAFLYERKYSMADVMRLCGWKKENTPQNVGGYLLDKGTNTMPIFVKYAASQYEDEFLNAQEMKYFSKNGRTPDSPEFQWVRDGLGAGLGPDDWQRTHFVPLFVMRKAEEADGKYYYVGHVAAFDHPTPTTKPNAAGDGTVKVTLSTLRLAKPLDPELYRHLTS
ncbi:DUF3427 domain-containing protein [Bifidobacterium miconis]|nr:DUF3427 domain-containing protein [Bifidobacterium miconis]